VRGSVEYGRIPRVLETQPLFVTAISGSDCSTDRRDVNGLTNRTGRY
jgi:hypothetical protein